MRLVKNNNYRIFLIGIDVKNRITAHDFVIGKMFRFRAKKMIRISQEK